MKAKCLFFRFQTKLGRDLNLNLCFRAVANPKSQNWPFDFLCEGYSTIMPFIAYPKNYEILGLHSRREKVVIYMLFKKRVCLDNDLVLVTGRFCHIPAVYCGDATEKGTCVSERVFKIPVFLTSSGLPAWRSTQIS